MTALPPHPSSLSLAKESLVMSEKTGDKNFQRMATGLMALTGIGTLLHLCHEILRDLRPKRETGDSGHTDRPTVPQWQEEPHQFGRPDQYWVARTGVSERSADGEKTMGRVQQPPAPGPPALSVLSSKETRDRQRIGEGSLVFADARNRAVPPSN